MWYNVWFVIWPAQQVVIASATAVAGGGQADPAAAGRGARAGLASRTNALFSIPMLFFMAAASHFPSLTAGLDLGEGSLGVYWIVFLALAAVLEWNALSGTGKPLQKPLATVSGTIHFGLGRHAGAVPGAVNPAVGRRRRRRAGPSGTRTGASPATGRKGV